MDVIYIFRPKYDVGAVLTFLYSYVAYVLIMLANGLNMESEIIKGLK